MDEVYNFRVGDMLWNIQGDQDTPANVIGLIYKLTPGYAYYAICARRLGEPEGKHFITKGHKVKKERLYKAVKEGELKISYAKSLKRRRKIKIFP